jgi:hypothetical protein
MKLGPLLFPSAQSRPRASPLQRANSSASVRPDTRRSHLLARRRGEPSAAAARSVGASPHTSVHRSPASPAWAAAAPALRYLAPQSGNPHPVSVRRASLPGPRTADGSRPAARSPAPARPIPPAAPQSSPLFLCSPGRGGVTGEFIALLLNSQILFTCVLCLRFRYIKFASCALGSDTSSLLHVFRRYG